MADNTNLHAAKAAKNDEFYTRYADIEAEMNAYTLHNPDVFRDKTVLLPCDDPEWSQFTRYFAANFDTFGLRKLISTSYALGAGNRTATEFETESSLYDPEKHESCGKLFVIDRAAVPEGQRVGVNDIRFMGYLKGDGDFRSEEVRKLRDEADVVVTNPPFSLFREFLACNGKDGGQMYPNGGGGSFGIGANGYADLDSNWTVSDSGGGGGGYYGGYGGCGAYEGAGGGSSFVSGYGSCPTVQGYTFRNVTYSVGSNNVSSLGGNGYCRIILVGT